jgi:hypothetical protein
VLAVNKRDLVVSFAAADVGLSDPKPYWRDVLGHSWVGPFPKHWCGAFVLSKYHEAGLCDWIWEISEINAPKGHYGYLRRLPKTTDPEPSWPVNRHRKVWASSASASRVSSIVATRMFRPGERCRYCSHCASSLDRNGLPVAAVACC